MRNSVQAWSVGWLMVGMGLLLGCQSLTRCAQMQARLSSLEQVVYRYQGSSLPPPYHRSYTVAIDSLETVLYIQDYRDTLLVWRATTTDSALFYIGQAIKKANLCPRKDTKPNDCTGQAMHYLTWQVDSTAAGLFTGYYYNCSGKARGTLKGSVKDWLTAVKPWFPPTDSLVKVTLDVTERH